MCPGPTFSRSRVTIELRSSRAPGPVRSILRSIEKSMSPAVSRTARYSSSVSVTTEGAAYPNRSIHWSVIAESRGWNAVSLLMIVPPSSCAPGIVLVAGRASEGRSELRVAVGGRQTFRNETDSRARLGDEVARVRRIGLELSPDRDEEHPDIVRLGVAKAPDLLEELALGDEPAGIARQELDHLPLGGRQADLMAVAADALGREVDAEVRCIDHRGLVERGRHAQGHPHARHELVHPEWLADVVVGPCVERRDLLAFLGPGGEHDDRDRRPAAEALDDLEAVHVRQSEVEYHRIGMVASGDGERLVAAGREVHLVATASQVDVHRPQQRGLVVDHQNSAHASARWRLKTRVAPPPAVSSTVNSPPIASVKPFATARPRPIPLGRPPAPSPRRWKGTKTRSRRFGGMPG